MQIASEMLSDMKRKPDTKWWMSLLNERKANSLGRKYILSKSNSFEVFDVYSKTSFEVPIYYLGSS